jgi:hypothetical protein
VSMTSTSSKLSMGMPSDSESREINHKNDS